MHPLVPPHLEFRLWKLCMLQLCAWHCTGCALRFSSNHSPCQIILSRLLLLQLRDTPTGLMASDNSPIMYGVSQLSHIQHNSPTSSIHIHIHTNIQTGVYLQIYTYKYTTIHYNIQYYTLQYCTTIHYKVHVCKYTGLRQRGGPLHLCAKRGPSKAASRFCRREVWLR